MAILCTICARGGSKGVKNKNLREIFKKPLIAHTIIQAKKSNLFQYIAVSSDSDEILNSAQKSGAQYLIKRPDELATDSAAKVPVIRHCAQEVAKQSNSEFDIVVDLDCTSPLRLPEDIVGSVELLRQTKCQNVITGAAARRSPYFNLVEQNEEGRINLVKSKNPPITRRQDAPKCFDLNASIYVWRWYALMNFDSVFLEDTRLFEMPEERSQDIDSEMDFEIVKLLADNRGFLS